MNEPENESANESKAAVAVRQHETRHVCGCIAIYQPGKAPVYINRCGDHLLSLERASEDSVRGRLEKTMPWPEFEGLLAEAREAQSRTYEEFTKDDSHSLDFAALNGFSCHVADFLKKVEELYERNERKNLPVPPKSS